MSFIGSTRPSLTKMPMMPVPQQTALHHDHFTSGGQLMNPSSSSAILSPFSPSLARAPPVASRQVLSDLTNTITPHVLSPAYVMNAVRVHEHECITLLDERVNRHLAASPLKTAAATHGNGSTFRIDHSRFAKGFGMFASTNISAGGVILTESPVIILSAHSESLRLSNVYNQLAGRLHPSVREQFFKLASNHLSRTSDDVKGIIETNALDVELPLGEHSLKHRAVFLATSRCNHSCGPNASWKWDATSMTLTLYSTRRIQANEEITIPYIDIACDRQTRMHNLATLHNIDCHCPHCLPTLHPSIVDASDKARLELRYFWSSLPSFEDWYSNPNMTDDFLISMHRRALVLREKEAIHSCEESRKHADAIAMCYGALGDVENFTAWTLKARKYRGTCGSSGTETMVVLDIWLETPELFPVWGWRKKGTRSRLVSKF